MYERASHPRFKSTDREEADDVSEAGRDQTVKDLL